MREESSRERTRLSSRSIKRFFAARLSATRMGSERHPLLFPEVLGPLDPFLKKGQRFVQGEPSLFQFLDDALEVGQGLFKTQAGHFFSFVRRSSSRVSRSISSTRQVNAPL